MVARFPREPGVITATYGMAWFSVHSLRRASAILRVVMPMTTIAASSPTRATAARRKPLRDNAGSELSGDMRCSNRTGRHFPGLPVHHAKHHGNENKRRNRRENQPSDHGAPERGILLTAFAKTQRHRSHADDH